MRGAIGQWGCAVALCIALLARAFGAQAVPAVQIVTRSREAAARGDYNTAARALEDLVAAGIDSSDVLYDLGTVYAHAGRYGEAIWRLEQVDRRSPFAFDARQNLRASRLLLAHRDAARSGRAVVETATPLGSWLGELLPLDWAVLLTLAGEIGAGVCLLFFFRRRGASESVRVSSVAGAVLFAGLSLFAGAIVVARNQMPPAAIVLHDGLKLLGSPAADAMAGAQVREGERLEWLGQNGAFARVRTPSGAVGWLATRDLGGLVE